MEEEFTQYLVSASENLLFEYGQTADQNDVKKLQDIVMVRLHAQFLRSLGDLQYCVSLKICDLSGNFLTNIDALECCPCLIKLDLHNNQIEELPGPLFWGNMRYLNLLYLHDNGISTLENVHSLSSCPHLIALTLLNTPLSLKIAYRHIVVNSILSLKALDYYVISDEEIMEDWRLPQKYKPFTPVFFVDFSPLPGKKSTFQEEMKVVREIISEINHVLAHYSPVLIVQKWIRGYLIRKILCVIPVCEVLRYNHYTSSRAKQICIQLARSVCDSKSSMHHIIKPEQHTEVGKLTSGIQVIDINDFKDTHLCQRRFKLPLLSSLINLEEKKKMKQKESKKSPRKDLLDWKKTEIMEEHEMATKFRLTGCAMPFYSVSDELQQHTEKERDFIDAVRDLRYVVRPVPHTMPVHEPGCVEKRAFARAYGTIRLRPLCAIDKAYWESQSWDVQLRKERKVMRMLIAQNETKEYVHRLHEERKDTFQKKNEEEKLMYRDFLKENKQNSLTLTSQMRQKYARFLENKDAKATERAFIQGFSTQHTSLARGLLRLDGWRHKQESIKRRNYIIKENLKDQKHRKEVFQHFQDQRQWIMQKQNAAEKMHRKHVANEMANERFQHSMAKMEAVKKPREKMLYTLPVISSSMKGTPIEEYDG